MQQSIRAKPSQAELRETANAALLLASHVCVCGTVYVWQHVVVSVCVWLWLCVWSVCQQLCCPLASFASDSFIHCTLPVGHSRPSGCPTWPRPFPVPSSLDCLSGRCRSAQTALAWPCITVAANQFESSGAHVKKKKESPKKRTTNFIFVAKTPLTAAPSLKRVKITTNLFGYAANCYSTPSIRSSSTSSSTSSSFFLLVLIIKNR